MKCTKMIIVICLMLVSLVIPRGAFADVKEDIEDILKSMSGYLEVLADDNYLGGEPIGAQLNIELNGRERARVAMLSTNRADVFGDEIQIDDDHTGRRIIDKAAFDRFAVNLFGEPVDTSLLGTEWHGFQDAALINGVPMFIEYHLMEGEFPFFAVLDQRIVVYGQSAIAELDVFWGPDFLPHDRPTERYTITFKKNTKPDNVVTSRYFLTGVNIKKIDDSSQW